MTTESGVRSTRMTRKAGEALVARWRASGLSAADFSRESVLSVKQVDSERNISASGDHASHYRRTEKAYEK